MLRGIFGSGGGAAIGGGGTSSPSTIPRWTGPSTLGDSVITQSGSNIGIGTASPSTRLHVSDNSSIPVIVQSSGSTDSYLRFINTSNNLGYIGYVGTNLYLAPNNGAGNVGIGTASPGTKLDVADTGTPSGTVGIRSLYTGTITANAGGVLALGGYFTGTSPTTFAYIVGGKDNATAGDFGGHLQFITRPNGGVYTERARIDSAGNLILNTANTGATIQAAGSQQGLKLPATPGNADAQTLDCYQELTWTPELRFGGATTGITYTVRQGYYTRVGNLVTVQCYFVLSSKGTATGVATIEGLPATVSASTGAFSGAAIGWIQNITYTSFPAFHANVGTTSIILWNPASGGAGAQLTDAQFAATSGVIFTMTYRV